MSTLEELKQEKRDNAAKITTLKKQIENFKADHPNCFSIPDLRAELFWLTEERDKLTQANKELTTEIVKLEAMQLELDKEKEKTKQLSASSGSSKRSYSGEGPSSPTKRTTPSATYAESYGRTDISYKAAKFLVGLTQLTSEQMQDWKNTLEANRGKKEVKEVQPAAQALFLRLANANGKANVAIDKGIKIGSKTSDFAIYFATRRVGVPGHIKCIGEMKKPPPAVKQFNNYTPVLNNFPREDKGQAMNYCINLLNECRYRQFVYSFLTDLEVVIIFQGRRNGDSIEITETHPLAYDEGGAAALLSLLLLSENLSGLDIPEISGWKVENPLGFGATSIAFKITKENSQDEAVFKYVFKPGSCLQTEVNFLKEVEGDGLPVFISSTNEGFIMTPVLKPFSTRPQKFHVEQLFSALKTIHDAGYVTRDVRPTNVMLSLNGEQAFITDFGFATKEGEETAYQGTLTTASDRILGILSKANEMGHDPVPVGVTFADEQESLVKCLYLMTDHIPITRTYPHQIKAYWARVPGVWRQILDDVRAGNFAAAKITLLGEL